MRSTLALVALLAACSQPPAGGDAHGSTPTPAAAAAAPEDAGKAVATIGGEPISLGDVDKEAGAQLSQVRQQIYDVRKQALDKLVLDRLMEKEAQKRGITKEELLKAEVEDKVAAPDEAEITKLFEENKARLNGQTLDEVRPRIVQFLSQKGKSERMQAFSDELKKAADVKVMLDPPRLTVDVPEGAPRFGSASAPVQIVEFSDFQCPFCSRAANTVHELEAKYGDKISIVFRNFPLEFHQNAQKAAEAAACAHEGGKFWEYHDKLFGNQSALGVDDLKKYAGEVGLDQAAFDTCLESGKHTAAISADQEAGKALGVQGTPGFFVNGRFLGGALPIEEFSKIVDEELARVN